MQVKHAPRKEDTNIHTTTQKYKISNTQKMVSILSDKLYSNKLLAPIREIICNATDAHIEAGTPRVPIEIHVPSQIKQDFWVRDFGVGLSHENVMHLYTTYGESLKDKSDDFIGGLGLGSKSPFAYTDSFVVISYFNGKKRQYLSNMNSTGEPTIRMVKEEDTVEPNGLHVQFSVRREDLSQFRRELFAFVEWMAIPPKLLNYSEEDGPKLYRIREVSPTLKFYKNLWVLYNEKEVDLSHFNSQFMVVMGDVAYPVDWSLLTNSCKDEKLRQALSVLKSCKFIYWGQIGEFPIIPSREGLEYTQPIINKLLSMLAQFHKYVMEEYDKQFEKINTYDDVYQFLYRNYYLKEGERDDEGLGIIDDTSLGPFFALFNLDFLSSPKIQKIISSDPALSINDSYWDRHKHILNKIRINFGCIKEIENIIKNNPSHDFNFNAMSYTTEAIANSKKKESYQYNDVSTWDGSIDNFLGRTIIIYDSDTWKTIPKLRARMMYHYNNGTFKPKSMVTVIDVPQKYIQLMVKACKRYVPHIEILTTDPENYFSKPPKVKTSKDLTSQLYKKLSYANYNWVCRWYSGWNTVQLSKSSYNSQLKTIKKIDGVTPMWEDRSNVYIEIKKNQFVIPNKNKDAPVVSDMKKGLKYILEKLQETKVINTETNIIFINQQVTDDERKMIKCRSLWALWENYIKNETSKIKLSNNALIAHEVPEALKGNSKIITWTPIAERLKPYIVMDYQLPFTFFPYHDWFTYELNNPYEQQVKVTQQVVRQLYADWPIASTPNNLEGDEEKRWKEIYEALDYYRKNK